MNWISVAGMVCAMPLWIAVGILTERRFARRAALKLEKPRLLNYEATVEGEWMRLTFRTPNHLAAVLVPKEMAYRMSDDLMRAAAHLGKRELPQVGSE